MTLNKKAQVWSLDLTIATILFFIGITILYTYAINYIGSSERTLNGMFDQANTASSILLREEGIGILSNGKINQTKIDSLLLRDYKGLKREIGVSDDFYLVIDGLSSNGNEVGFIGNKSISVKDNVKVTRLAVYNNKPVKFEIFVWR